jgi:hypothetical protein
MDPIVFLASKVPHLSQDNLPFLADYDHSEYLKEKCFKVAPFKLLFIGFLVDDDIFAEH